MKLFAQSPNGKRQTFIGDAYTFDVASECVAEMVEDAEWPAEHDAVLIEDKKEGRAYKLDFAAGTWHDQSTL